MIVKSLKLKFKKNAREKWKMKKLNSSLYVFDPLYLSISVSIAIATKPPWNPSYIQKLDDIFCEHTHTHTQKRLETCMKEKKGKISTWKALF